MRVVRARFDGATAPALLARAGAVVGLHPDQATEAIVDEALRARMPFAVVPCCVYPSLFPARRLRAGGQGVRRYRGFLQYLREKDARVRVARLPLGGRNLVLYVLPADAADDPRPPPPPR